MPSGQVRKIPCIKVSLRDKTGKLSNANRDFDIFKLAYNSKLEFFNAVKEKDKEVVNYLNYHASVIVKASILEQVLYDAARICRELPDAEATAEDTFIDDRNYLDWARRAMRYAHAKHYSGNRLKRQLSK